MYIKITDKDGEWFLASDGLDDTHLFRTQAKKEAKSFGDAFMCWKIVERFIYLSKEIDMKDIRKIELDF